MPYKNIEIGAPGYISGSQMANLYGCGFGTPLEVFNRLKGIEEEKEFSEEAQKSMEFGTFFEEPVAQFFMYKTGLKVKKVGEGLRAYFTKELPFLICHPDRIGVGKDGKGRRFALEIKCVRSASEGWGEEGTDEIPDYYFIQVQTYFATGVPCDVVYLACLRGNRVFIYEILPDLDVIADIRRRAKEFKENTDKGIVPEPANYDEAVSVYGRKADMENTVGANDEVLSIYNELLAVHERQKELEAEEEQKKMALMEKLGEASAFVVADGKKIRNICAWSETTRTSFDTKAFKKDNPSFDTTPYETTKTLRSFRINYPRSKENG